MSSKLSPDYWMNQTFSGWPLKKKSVHPVLGIYSSAWNSKKEKDGPISTHTGLKVPTSKNYKVPQRKLVLTVPKRQPECLTVKDGPKDTSTWQRSALFPWMICRNGKGPYWHTSQKTSLILEELSGSGAKKVESANQELLNIWQSRTEPWSSTGNAQTVSTQSHHGLSQKDKHPKSSSWMSQRQIPDIFPPKPSKPSKMDFSSPENSKDAK